MSEENKHEQFWFGGRRPWMPGVILIVLGAIFLLGNVTGFELENWWALFILIPALGNFASAYDHYRSSGEFNRSVRARLFWGLLLAMLSASFLFGVELDLVWPIFLILAGLAFLLGAF
jgi:hypothetical protein